MARAERFAPAGVPLHVTQRGNFRAAVFRGEGDYELYVRLLRLYARRYGNRVVGYCLMPNHVHLVVIPGHGEGLSAMLQALAGTSSRLLNERMERVGHVWQARFYSATLELHPLRAGLVERITPGPLNLIHRRRQPRPHARHSQPIEREITDPPTDAGCVEITSSPLRPARPATTAIGN